MCLAKKCCFFVPLDLGCIILGIIGFLISTLMTISSLVLMAIEGSHQKHLLKIGGPRKHFLQETIPMSKTFIDVVLGVSLFTGILWMIFSVMLVLGIQKNKPNLVVSSFAFGIVLTILSQLGALLLLLGLHWIPSFVLFTFSFINIHFLVVVHTVYEQMVRGKKFGFNEHRELDEESILDNESRQ